MTAKIENLKKEIQKEVALIDDFKKLEEFRIKYLGKKGSIASLFEELKDVPKEQKPAIGKELNELKIFAQNLFDEIQKKLEQSFHNEKYIGLDITLPARKKSLGRYHLITQTLNEIKTIFKGMGFSVAEGPELESDFYNFEALNFPSDHPARDMQDTYFISEKFLLRTHTSPVQIRVMEKLKPPIRHIMPGRVFRNEAISARSYCMFHQVEGLYVDTDVTFAELKGSLVAFAKQFYGNDLKYRFRPSFFPFTEPSAEMDITCFLCGGKGCRVCKYSGWLEILGCGMVDPNVFKSVNYDIELYQGYAFGMGIERIGLLKYGINDIRLYFENDVRFLKQF